MSRADEVTTYRGYQVVLRWEGYTTNNPVCHGELREGAAVRYRTREAGSPHAPDAITEAAVRDRLREVADRLLT